MNVQNWSTNGVALTVNGAAVQMPPGGTLQAGMGVTVTVAGGSAYADTFAHSYGLLNDDSGVVVVVSPGPGYYFLAGSGFGLLLAGVLLVVLAIKRGLKVGEVGEDI